MKFLFDNFDLEIGFDEIKDEHPDNFVNLMDMLVDVDSFKEEMNSEPQYFEIIMPASLDYIQTDLVMDDGVTGEYNEDIENELKKLLEEFTKGLEDDE